VTNADRAIDFVLEHEGGYTGPTGLLGDPGGETNFGISKRSYPNVDVKNLTRDGAADIYHRDYWNPICGDELHGKVALVLMDYAVNSGTGRAVKALQGILGVRQDALLLDRALFLTRLGITRRGSDAFLVGWMKRIRDNLRAIRGGRDG
jgi:lysozyme family protein